MMQCATGINQCSPASTLPEKHGKTLSREAAGLTRWLTKSLKTACRASAFSEECSTQCPTMACPELTEMRSPTIMVISTPGICLRARGALQRVGAGDPIEKYEFLLDPSGFSVRPHRSMPPSRRNSSFVLRSFVAPAMVGMGAPGGPVTSAALGQPKRADRAQSNLIGVQAGMLSEGLTASYSRP